MSPECLKMCLRTRITRQRIFGRDLLDSIISQIAHLLLDDAGVEKSKELRLQYLYALCDAVAYNLSPWEMLDLQRSSHATAGISDLSEHMLAAMAAIGSKQQLQTLLSNDVDPNVKSKIFGFAAQNAARIGQEDMVLLLLEYDTKVPDRKNAAEATAAALKAACEIGQERVVQSMLVSQDKIDVLPAHFEAAVVAAAQNGHVDLVRLLLESGTFTNKENVIVQSFLQASRRGFTDVVQILIESGVDVNIVDHTGFNALNKAAMGGHTLVVRQLLQHGAKYDAVIYKDPLFLAGINGHEDVVQMLLDCGAPLNGKGNIHCPLLIQAARKGESRMVRFCLEKGVDLNVCHHGDLALKFAAEHGHEDTVRLLAGFGADVNGREDQDSPMLTALVYGRDRMVKTLLGLGAKEVNPLETCYAAYFEAGQFPVRRP